MGLTIKKETEKKIIVPNKPGINLVVEKEPVNVTRVVITTLIIVAIAAVGAKFGIVDFISKRAELNRQLKEQQDMTLLLTAKLATYKDLEEQYGKYSYGWMTESEAALLEREYVFRIVNDKVSEFASIESMSLRNNTMSLTISGITLDEGREIKKTLEEEGKVSSATISSAKAEGDDLLSTITMTIEFQKEVTVNE